MFADISDEMLGSNPASNLYAVLNRFRSPSRARSIFSSNPLAVRADELIE
jgi:hypothetical protein